MLEVVCLHVRDVAAAAAGGADRILLLRAPESGGLSPEPLEVSAACRESDVPVRAMLRLNEGLSTSGGEFSRLIGLATDYLDMGVSGLSFGFLDADLQIDEATTIELIGALPEVAWSFHRGFDSALSTEHAWRSVLDLPGLDGVATGGSSRGLPEGADDLIARAERDPAMAALVIASGGLMPDVVPWLVHAGIRQFGIGRAVRPGRTWSKAYVDEGMVRSWRSLIDHEVDRLG